MYSTTYASAVVMTTTNVNNITLNVTGSDVTSMKSHAAGGDCIPLQFEEYVPWNNPDNLLSAEVEATGDRIKSTIVLPIFFLIGGPANVINMAVFWKQGLRERINLCLFSLSLADELYLIQNIFISGERMFTEFSSIERFGPVSKFMANHNLVGFFGFSFVSQAMSAIIASERCFCVVSPLRSQHVLTTRTMGVIIAGVYVTVVGVYFVVASRYHISCVLDPETGAVFNALVGGKFYHRNKEIIDYLDFFVYGLGLPGIIIVIVVSTTTVTTVKLRQSAAWRAAASSAAATRPRSAKNNVNNPDTRNTTASSNTSLSPNTDVHNFRTNPSRAGTVITSREVALTKMLIAASVLFLVCVTPISLFRFVMLFIPDLTTGGRQHNTFLFSLWMLEILSFVNSSFNIVVYYTMGSRFRDTLKDMFGGRCRPTSRAAEPRKHRLEVEGRSERITVSEATETTETAASSQTCISVVSDPANGTKP